MAGKKEIAIEIKIKNIKQIKVLENQLKKLRKEQRELAKTNKEAKKLSGEEAKLYERKHKAITKSSKALREHKKALEGANKKTKAVTKSSNGMAKQFIKGAAAIGIVVGAFRAVNRIVSSVISVFSEFEFVMSKVNAVSGATASEFKDLTATAEELGRTTFFTAAQVGELMLNFSKLGFTAREIQDAVQPTLDLATATGSDLARAALVAGAAVRGFGLDASETQRVVDVMAVSFSSSAMNIEKWQTSMTKVAPIAKAAGFSIEDTAAIMSKLTDSGIEASIAGTSLRNILLKMQDPTSELSMRFGTTIHSLDQLVPAMKQFVAEGGSMADVMEVVDIRQAAAFEQMLTTADGTLALRDALLDANGEGARMAGIVGDTLQGAFLKFTSALQGLSISVMKDFAGGMQGMVEGLAKFMNMLAKNSKTITTTIKVIIKLAKWFGIYKLTLMAVRIQQKYFTAELVATRIAMKATAVASWTLAGSLKALKASWQSLLASTGVGLLVILLTELASYFLLAKDEADDLTSSLGGLGDSVKKMTDDYHDSLKPIEKLKTSSKELIRIKGLMNDMVDDEGKLLEDTAINQKIYNKYKGQAAILTRGLNTELKNNNQDLITEKTSIEGVATAIDTLTASLMNQALVKGFEKQIEKVAEVAANAEVTRQKLRAAFDLESWLDIKSWEKTLQTVQDHNVKFGNKSSESFLKFQAIIKEGGFSSADEMIKAIEGSDEQIEIITKAFENLGLDFSTMIKKIEDDTEGGAITKWSDKMALALLAVKQKYSEVGASSEDYKDATIKKTKEILNEELTALEILKDKTKGQKDRIIQINTRLADLTMQQNDISFKKELDGLTDTYNTEKTLLANKYTVNGRVTEEGNALLLNLEAAYLTDKGNLHGKYGEKLLGIDAQIAASNQKVADQQRKIMEEQISAMGGVGSALTSLAGDNEKLNFIKEAGNKISMVANALSAIATIKTNLETLSNMKKAASENVATGSTILGTIADTLSLVPKAIGAILNQGKGDPYTAFFRMIAMTALVAKVMGMYEKGGVIDDGKYAKGGMVHGASHAQGGVKFAVGGRVNELEGGEAVINKRSTAMFRNQLSEMNQAGGGVKFADGGLMSSPAFTEAQFNANNQSQMMGAMSGQRKVVVVESDITNSQSTVSVIQANASF